MFSRRFGQILALVITVSMLLTPVAFAEKTGPTITDGPLSVEAPQASHRLIVELESPPLAGWYKAQPNLQSAGGKLDASSPSAQAYINQLKTEQAAFVNAMQAAVPSASVDSYIDEFGTTAELSYQVVLNGLTIDPGAMDRDEARRALAKLPGVKAVYLDLVQTTDLYTSTTLINAPAVWSQVGGQANGGDGIIVASMDGGAHKDAPMFDGTGYSYPGGWPAGGKGLTANNNGKIVTSRAYFRTFDPPAPGDENPWPGENGTSHGTHTASTAAGNMVTGVTYAGANVPDMSGVAPAAWVASYRVFYASQLGDGSFHNAEGVKALEDIVLDGADVLNNSWGGGPGSIGGEFDVIDTALINVANAGIFVTMSAGNAGPGNGTTDHPSPDYINVAASTTSGTYSAGEFNIIAPEPISPTLQAMPYIGAAFGDPLPIGQVITHPYVTAFSVNPANFEGCDPWPAGTFTDKAAVISRGSCEFGVKVLNAEDAGAEFVVIHNHAAGGDDLVYMGGGEVGHLVTIPSIFIGNTADLGVVQWYEDHGAASVLDMNTIAFQAGAEPDRIVSFSSRGPGVGNVLKPDIAAPGSNIMAQGYAAGATGEDRHLGYGQASGTSMAAPHVTGAAALVRQVHPGWTNAQIKSALMSTSKYMDIYNFDGTPAQPLDMGAGRLDLTNATDPGVILDPPSLSFGLVPTGTTETVVFTMTNVSGGAETYTLTTLFTGGGFTMTTELPGFSVTPTSTTLAPAATQRVTVTFDSALGMGLGDNQGYIIMEGDTHHAHAPAWARVTPATPMADVLIIQNDFSYLLGYPDYLDYYTDALDELGLTYAVWNADMYFNNPTSIPHAAILSPYKAVVYFTGDNFHPDGTFTVPTPLTALDMDRLTEYANGGGIVIAMGQDAASVMNESFFAESVLGSDYLQDSVTAFAPPSLPIVPLPSAPADFQSVWLDLSAPDTYLGAAQLTPDDVVTYKYYLPLIFKNGAAAALASGVTATASDPSGTGAFGYDVPSNRLDYDIQIDVTNTLTITEIYIRRGAAGETGPVAHSLLPAPVEVTDTLTVDGAVILSAEDGNRLIAGELYVEVHSASNPFPELRGQIVALPVGDGAANQLYIDENATVPNKEPETPWYEYNFVPLLKYPGPYNIEDGLTAIAHRDQPSLERPGISFLGRTIYTTFGLEGVNNGVPATSREELLGLFFDWAMDEPTVTISHTESVTTSLITMFEATVTSPITGTTGTSYRWDFGDGSDYAGPFTHNEASHAYATCGTKTVRVEAIDSLGNRALGVLEVNVTECP